MSSPWFSGYLATSYMDACIVDQDVEPGQGVSLVDEVLDGLG